MLVNGGPTVAWLCLDWGKRQVCDAKNSVHNIRINSRTSNGEIEDGLNIKINSDSSLQICVRVEFF